MPHCVCKLDRASFTDYSKAARVRKTVTAYAGVVETNCIQRERERDVTVPVTIYKLRWVKKERRLSILWERSWAWPEPEVELEPEPAATLDPKPEAELDLEELSLDVGEPLELLGALLPLWIKCQPDQKDTINIKLSLVGKQVELIENPWFWRNVFFSRL